MKINSCFCFPYFSRETKTKGKWAGGAVRNNNNVYGFDYEIFRFNFMELNGGKRLTPSPLDCNVYKAGLQLPIASI